MLIIINAGCADVNTNSKLPTGIIEANHYLRMSISVRPESEKNVFATIAYKNLSPKDTFLLYKKLLPVNGEIRENIFGIFATKSLSPVKYCGYKSGLEYYHDFAIKPVLDTSCFIQLLPGRAISYKTNLAESYNFSPLLKKGEHVFAIASRIAMPLVNIQYQHVFRIDTLDNISKPVYYYIDISTGQNADSLRTIFSVP
ncbi:MAG TPA: hypothetical protein VG738_17910 [Chitinophagaceae bacterium]|nr:hypothetical protein [Chitinophagaceae bacterium]